jgi:hypothetical protein
MYLIWLVIQTLLLLLEITNQQYLQIQLDHIKKKTQRSKNNIFTRFIKQQFYNILNNFKKKDNIKSYFFM